ncbi:MAG: DNA polymerase III subunit delta' [candidate division NC10 bacterium]|nr:DNA polymerase III subunit delta' [candidate division NC10 bacterium]MBI2116081.1 DNA polymerase III subunit delta' [candidate division NC10 bacterium]
MPLAEILGQDRAVAFLRSAWRTGRLSQAYCFAGPAGVGKRTAALALAQAINCLAAGNAASQATADACGRCAACRKIAAGNHPDVIEVRPEEKTVITIDQIREVAARASLRAYEGRAKVWILDPADQMQEPAANAFLKTLEEPAGVSLFILVTATPSALLPTILSRCQEVRFDLLGEGHLRDLLARHGRPPEAAALAGGSAARALALDVAEAHARRDRIVQEVWDALGSLPAVLERADDLGSDRPAFEAALEILAGYTRDMIVAKIAGGAVPLVHGDREADVARLAARYPVGAILNVFEAQVEAQRALARRANPRFTAERMLLRMRDAVGRGQPACVPRTGREGSHGPHGSG